MGQRALVACVDLARADGELSDEEQVFLTALGKRFRDDAGPLLEE